MHPDGHFAIGSAPVPSAVYTTSSGKENRSVPPSNPLNISATLSRG